MRREYPSLMEPLLPEPGNKNLEDLAASLIERAGKLSCTVHHLIEMEMGHLLRTMNCYYSNLIEDHHTHPRDIERALKMDYSKNPQKRNLQLEAKAHVLLQEKLDLQPLEYSVLSMDFINWLHLEFCKNLPDELLWFQNPDTGEKIKMVPGQFRDRNIAIGNHVPIDYQAIPLFLQLFMEAYNPHHLSRVSQVIATAASHHRLLWIHPFLDGNGRVTRLFTNMYFREIGISNSLWSVARGLARNARKYKNLLMYADSPRQGDLDGRGNLSQKALIHFCEFFLDTCIDQINFMENLLKPKQFMMRMERCISEKIALGELHKGSLSLIREAYLLGEFPRGRAGSITGYKERQARTILNELLNEGLLKSDSPKSSVRLAFPSSIVSDIFPNLYPD